MVSIFNVQHPTRAGRSTVSMSCAYSSNVPKTSDAVFSRRTLLYECDSVIDEWPKQAMQSRANVYGMAE